MDTQTVITKVLETCIEILNVGLPA